MTRPVIDEEIAALLPPLTPEEYAELEMKVSVEGFRDRLVVWKETGILLDGHNRLRICDKYGIAYAIDELSFPDRGRAIQWLIDNQLGRRNLTDERRAYYRGKEYLNKKQQHVCQTVSGGQNVHPGQRVAAALAEKHGVNEKTIRRDAAFAEAVDRIGEADPAQKEAILSGTSGQTKQDVIESATSPAASTVSLDGRQCPSEPAEIPISEVKCARCKRLGLPGCPNCEGAQIREQQRRDKEARRAKRAAYGGSGKKRKSATSVYVTGVYDWSQWNRSWGSMRKVIDAIARAHKGEFQGPEHKEMIDMLSKLVEKGDAWKERLTKR
jgi:hypothetical protein